MTNRAIRYPAFDLFEVHEEAVEPAPSGAVPMEFTNADPGGDRGEFDRPAGGLKGALREIMHAAAVMKGRAECRIAARNNVETQRAQEAQAAIELVTKHKELMDTTAELEKTYGLRFVD
ncbi:MAG: hypothetical protein M0P69_22145 [Bacteroidales bacterium]|nr:hypothetical protein [Bacteroidales bacterium]